MKFFRRIVLLVLVLALLCALFPPSLAAERGPDEVFAQLYRTLGRTKAAGDEAFVDVCEALLMDAPGVVPGSVYRQGSGICWSTADGTACRISPYLYSLATTAASAAEPTPSICRKESKSAPEGRDIFLFGPYYGIDEDFEGIGGSYDSWGDIAAHFTGGGYYRYARNDATIDAIAAALEDSALVLIDSHGETDGVTSYICLESGAGITSEDYAYDPDAGVSHAYYGGFGGSGMHYYEVDGTAIANHMDRPASDNFLWNGTCSGMATDGISRPLLARGVAAVYGYSEEVSFDGDRAWFDVVMDELTYGKDLRTAIANMKKRLGAWDYSPQLCELYDWPSAWACRTESEARRDYSAFPVVVSAQDAFPARPSSVQTVRSTWHLPRVDLTIRFHTPDGVKAPKIAGFVFYKGTLPIPSGRPRDESQTYRFEGWSYVPLAPQSYYPAQVLPAGMPFSFGYGPVDGELSFGDESGELYAIYSYTDAGRTWYATQIPDGPYDPYDPSALFDDMPYGTWYYANVRYGLAEGLVSGYTDGCFHPEKTLRRSEVVCVLYRAAGSPEVTSERLFSDVDPDCWYGPAVTWASQNGIVQGYADGTFRPDQSVTRAQLAVLLCRASGSPEAPLSSLAEFPDRASVPAWAEAELAWAVSQGLINGNQIGGARYLQPGKAATRAQFIAILQRHLSAA